MTAGSYTAGPSTSVPSRDSDRPPPSPPSSDSELPTTSAGPSGTAGSGPSPDVQRFLEVARQTYPGLNTALLEQRGHQLCTRLQLSTSTHDLVGELTGELGNQPAAQQLVRTASAAYCPGAADQ